MNLSVYKISPRCRPRDYSRERLAEQVKVQVNMDSYSTPRREHTSKALRYGTDGQATTRDNAALIAIYCGLF